MGMQAGGAPRPGSGRGSALAAAQRVNLARHNSNQSVSATPTNVVWDTVNWQDGFSVVAGDSAIIVPATGRYQINFNLLIGFLEDTVGDNFVEATVRLNGAIVLQAPHHAVRLLAPGGGAWAIGGTSAVLVPCVGVMDLVALDSLTFTVLEVPASVGVQVPYISAVNTVTGAPGTTLSIHRLS